MTHYCTKADFGSLLLDAVQAFNQKTVIIPNIMDVDIFETLNSGENPDEARQALRDYLNNQIKEYLERPEDSERIAYEIAGLLATKTVSTLPKDDPYLQILELAGELELPEDHRQPDSTWPALIEKIERLN
jgi:hypothetical protein